MIQLHRLYGMKERTYRRTKRTICNAFAMIRAVDMT